MPPNVSQVIPEVAVLSSKSTPETTDEFDNLLAEKVNLAQSEPISAERNEIASRETTTDDESTELDTQNELLAMAFVNPLPTLLTTTAYQDQAAGEATLADPAMNAAQSQEIIAAILPQIGDESEPEGLPGSAVDGIDTEMVSQEGTADAPSALSAADRKVALDIEGAASTQTTPENNLNSLQSQATGGDTQQQRETPDRPVVEASEPSEQQAPDGVSVINTRVL